ncbi:MAG: hypothetical protein QXH80_00835, partial [Candidatus Nanoarchaeia archaeon]
MRHHIRTVIFYLYNFNNIQPSLLPFLRKLYDEGVKIALCSSDKNARAGFDKLDISYFFQDINISSEISKPEIFTDVFLKIAEKLRTPAFHCLVFTDSEIAVNATIAAKMKCIGIGNSQALPSAPECITDFSTIDLYSLLDAGRSRGIPVEAWKITEEQINLKRAGYWGTIFALTNGYLGVRGNYDEEINNLGSQPGTFVNGIVGYEKYNHIWGFPGFAESLHAVLNICSWTGIKLFADGEEFSLLDSDISNYKRSLDMKRGILEKELIWKTATGKNIKIKSVRFASMHRRHCSAMRYEVSADQPTEITLTSAICLDMPSQALPGKQIEVVQNSFKNGIHCFKLNAVTGKDQVASAFVNEFCCSGKKVIHDNLIKDANLFSTCAVNIETNDKLTLEKIAVFHSTLEHKEANIMAIAFAEAEKCKKAGFDRLSIEQEEFWRDYWEKADIKIDGAEQDQQALRFSLFHLRQSHPEDPKRSIGANGITGDKYCGHVFWDTEMYMLPHFLYTEPEIVKNLLLYRYNILDKARERARQLDGKGACYSWNSITGEECCVVFEAATAEYHLNSAIAWGIFRYVDATGDIDFLYDYGAEIIFETAQFMADLGGFVPLKNGEFRINAVCGPDEYGCGVNNNCYLNSMAQWHFNYAAEIFNQMRKNAPQKLSKLQAKTGISEKDVELWKKAAEKMFIPYNQELGIHEENDTFLGLEPVDMDLIPKNTDIRETMHPLNLWRLQVIKQADVV